MSPRPHIHWEICEYNPSQYQEFQNDDGLYSKLTPLHKAQPGIRISLNRFFRPVIGANSGFSLMNFRVFPMSFVACFPDLCLGYRLKMERTQHRNELNIDDPSQATMEVVRDEHQHAESPATESSEHQFDFDELEATPDEVSGVVAMAIAFLLFALILLAGTIYYFW